TAANEADVVRICERLDGIPLALELAAARIKVLSVEQIAARLADRFRLLTGGSRTALPRHQTLWAAMDWSHELLTPAEQALFRRLSVFAGGFTLEAVEAVGSGQWAMRSSGSPPPIADCRLPVASEHDVLDLLTSLVDKSLVIAEERDGAVRYRLLETVRQYAAEKLEEAGETEQARDRHLEWYLELAQTAETEIWTAGEPEWLTRLEQEHDNLRAALAWSLAEGAGRSPDRRGLGNRTEPALSRAKGSPIPNGERAMRLAGALPRFWERRGHLSEGRRWLAQALEAGEVASAEVRASALYGAGTLAYMQGDYAAARAACEQSLLLCQEAGNQQGAAEAQRTLGYIALRYGEYDAARASFEASLATHTELGCKPGIARARGGLGMLAYRQGDCDAARAHYEASLALHREFGHKDGIASTLDDLATVAGEQHAGAEQAALLEESLTLYREIGNRQGIALVLASLGMAAWARGEHDRAPALLKESLTLYREVGDQRGVARLLGHQSVVALYQRDYARAAVLCRESLALYQELGDRWTIARYLPVLAGAAFGQRQPVRAARLFGAAAAMRRSLSAALPPVVRQTHDRTVAAVHAVLGDGPFQAAWSEGQDASLEATIACALSDQEPA
ncbi:MAG: ATP-binding protein, partial [Dehalococcoidia bacterium]